MDHERTCQTASRSPSPPPYSPITPEPALATLAGPVDLHSAPPQLPPNIPISESTNPDVIALRSALSVLQLQRLRSIQDVQTLNRQKGLALSDPEAFAQDLVDGNIRSVTSRNGLEAFEEAQGPPDDENGEDREDELSKPTRDIEKETFGNIPAPQNIVRCPPVNWAKYHVLGNVLDQLHEQQRRQPASGQLQRDMSTTTPHFVAAPYSPWQDKMVEKVEKTDTESSHH